MSQILVVDDDYDARNIVRTALENANYSVLEAVDGQTALRILETEKPGAVVLDVAMPGMNGIEICRRIRSNPFWSKIPILFVTAKDTVDQITAGLDAGADDYLVKPVRASELIVRVRAMLRRAPGGKLDGESSWLTIGDLSMHTTQLVCRVQDHRIDLTATEHRLLHTLMMNSDQPISLEILLQYVWDYPPHTGNPNIVHVTIKRLRSKLQYTDDSHQYILNVRGRGYMVSRPIDSESIMAS